MQEIRISVFNVAGNSFCLESEDGQKVYDLLCQAIQQDKKVELSFQNVELLTSAFLNTAIGQLYRDFEEDRIKNSLVIVHLSPEDKALLKRVIRTAKLYYQDPQRMMRSIQEILGE